MADELNQLPQDVLDALPEGYQVAVANLSEQGQQQVVEALQDPNYNGDASDALLQAQSADGHRENVEALHLEQAKAIEAGDLDKAADLAFQSEWEVRAVQGDGGEGDAQLVQAQKDESNIDNAQWHDGIAQDHLQTAAWDAASGNDIGAADAAAAAGSEMSVAATSAGLADQGGADASHAYDASASTGGADASATATE